MKSVWITKSLGELCEIYQPKTISTKEMVVDGQYPVHGANGIIGRYDKFNHEEPQLLITCRGATCGSVNISEPYSWITGNAMVVRPKANSISLKFLEFIFRGGIDLSHVITGAAQPQITRTNLAPIKVSFPADSNEQQRIVAILEEAFEGISTVAANAEKNLANTRELFDSYLQRVDAEWKALGDYIKISTGKLDANAATKDGEYPFFTCSKQIYSIDVHAFDCEAVLLAGNNASGDFNVKHYKGKFNAYQRTYVLTVPANSELLYRYLYFQLVNSLKVFKQQAVGTNTKFLKLGMIKDLQIPMPSLPEQKKIVAILDSLSEETQSLEGIYQQKLEALDELKKSILHRAFSGQLH